MNKKVKTENNSSLPSCAMVSTLKIQMISVAKSLVLWMKFKTTMTIKEELYGNEFFFGGRE